MEIFLPLREGSVQMLAKNGGLSPAMRLTLLDQMLQALRFLADRGVVHRDVKPSNILWQRSEESTEARYRFQLSNFGLCDTAPRIETAAEVLGTQLYTAPECLMRRERQTHKSDV